MMMMGIVADVAGGSGGASYTAAAEITATQAAAAAAGSAAGRCDGQFKRGGEGGAAQGVERVRVSE